LSISLALLLLFLSELTPHERVVLYPIGITATVTTTTIAGAASRTVSSVIASTGAVVAEEGVGVLFQSFLGGGRSSDRFLTV
jgi:hypothetical protein